MNIIVAHATGFSVDNDSTIKERMEQIMIDGKPHMKIYRHIIPKHLYNVKSEPDNECQVLTDNGKGFFCIFESNRKIKIMKDMSENEVKELKHNLKKWQT